MATTDGPRRQRRAPVACDFCRYRKIKCNSEKPVCQTCKEHARDCTYTDTAKKPRPSTMRITQLEQENKKLQERLLSLKEHVENGRTFNGSSTSNNWSPAYTSSNQSTNSATKRNITSSEPLEKSQSSRRKSASNPANVRRPFSPDKESDYHGPTSAVFDEKSAQTGMSHTSADITKLPELWVRRQLVAEAARQRQLETVNFLDGNLDFDGVDPELGMHLLSIYWNRQHSSGPVVYRPTFMRDMACAGPYFSKLLLNAIYFHACKFTSRKEVRTDPNNRLTAGWVYRQRAVELLSQEFHKSNITTIQALLVMSSVLFSWCDEKNTSWLYAGMAFNMIIGLGIHLDAVTLRRQFSEEEIEVRSRIFWSAFVLDKLHSVYQGRPSCLSESITNLSIKFLDDHEELELFDPLSYTESSNPQVVPGYNISIFVETCKLCLILEKLLRCLYIEKMRSRDPDHLIRESKAIDTELQDWRKSLPEHFDLNSSNADGACTLPHTLSLLATYNVLIILLHRPFVSDARLHSISSSFTLDAFYTCSSAAFEIDHILQTYERFLCLRSTPYIISYATYVSATIHVRLAAQMGHESHAHKALRRCLDVLEIHQSVCWAPRRAKRVIDALVARMGVVVGSEASVGGLHGLTLPNLDIYAIIQTFARDNTSSDAQMLQQKHSEVGTVGIGKEITPGCTMLQSTTATDDNAFDVYSMPLFDDDFGFSYDPIFGFNGSTFNNLDFGFDGDFEIH